VALRDAFELSHLTATTFSVNGAQLQPEPTRLTITTLGAEKDLPAPQASSPAPLSWLELCFRFATWNLILICNKLEFNSSTALAKSFCTNATSLLKQLFLPPLTRTLAFFSRRSHLRVSVLQGCKPAFPKALLCLLSPTSVKSGKRWKIL